MIPGYLVLFCGVGKLPRLRAVSVEGMSPQWSLRLAFLLVMRRSVEEFGPSNRVQLR